MASRLYVIQKAHKFVGLSYVLYFYILCLGVSVRWEYATYTVSEQDETVVLSLVLIGTLSTNVTVQVATRDGTARGMYHNQFILR